LSSADASRARSTLNTANGIEGEEAVALARRLRPDVVLIDAALPGAETAKPWALRALR
jgi:DNA-binding NarL/FixJ family response regulator